MRRAVRGAYGRGSAGGRRRGGGAVAPWRAPALPRSRPRRWWHPSSSPTTCRLPCRVSRTRCLVGVAAAGPPPVTVGGGGGKDGGGNPPPLFLVLPVPAAFVALLPPAGPPPSDPLLATAALSTLLTIAVVYVACAALTPAFPAVAAVRVPPLHVAVTPAVALLRALAIHDGALSVVTEVGPRPRRRLMGRLSKPPTVGLLAPASSAWKRPPPSPRRASSLLSCGCWSRRRGTPPRLARPPSASAWQGARRCARRPVGRPRCSVRSHQCKHENAHVI